MPGIDKILPYALLIFSRGLSITDEPLWDNKNIQSSVQKLWWNYNFTSMFGVFNPKMGNTWVALGSINSELPPEELQIIFTRAILSK